MAKHYNPSIVERSNQIFNTKTGDHVSSEVAPVISPVVELRYNQRVANGQATNATSGNIFTTSATKDTYITCMSITVKKDATSDSTFTDIIAVDEKGSTRSLISLATLTLSAVQGLQTTQNLPWPGMKLARNTAITLRNGTATANIESFGQVYFYEVETTKGGQ